MDDFEKVEKLRQRANVTYEEAKDALKEANGDLLDAMVILEKNGKVKSPDPVKEESSVSGEYQLPVKSERRNSAAGEETFGTKFKRVVKRGIRYLGDNNAVVTHKGEVVINIPLWLAVIALFMLWEIILIVMIISLFFECRYSIVGKDEKTNNEVNKVMEKASDLTEKVKDEFDKI